MEYEIHIRTELNPSAVPGGSYLMIKSGGIYTIEGRDIHGEIKISRKYNEFSMLRSFLQLKWPGIPLPIIPTQRLLPSDPFHKDLREMLESFLHNLFRINYIASSAEFQLFLRNEDSFESISSTFKVEYSEISSTFQALFPEFVRKTDGEVLSSYDSQLRELLEGLKMIKKQIRAVHDSHFSFEEKFLRLLELVENADDQPSHRKSTGSFEEYAMVYDWIECEISEVQALVEAMQGLLELNNKVLLIDKKIEKERGKIDKIKEGGVSVSSILNITRIKTSGKRENLINDLQDEKEQMVALCDIVACKLCSSDIPRYKDMKNQRFKKMIKGFAEFSTVYFKSLIDIIYYTFNLHLT